MPDDSSLVRAYLKEAQHQSHFNLKQTTEGVDKQPFSHQHYKDPQMVFKICYLRREVPYKNASLVELKGVSAASYVTESQDRYRNRFQAPPKSMDKPISKVVFGTDPETNLETANQRQQRSATRVSNGDLNFHKFPAGQAGSILSNGLRESAYGRQVGPTAGEDDLLAERRRLAPDPIHGGPSVREKFGNYDQRTVHMCKTGNFSNIPLDDSIRDPLHGVLLRYPSPEVTSLKIVEKANEECPMLRSCAALRPLHQWGE